MQIKSLVAAALLGAGAVNATPIEYVHGLEQHLSRDKD